MREMCRMTQVWNPARHDIPWKWYAALGVRLAFPEMTVLGDLFRRRLPYRVPVIVPVLALWSVGFGKLI